MDRAVGLAGALGLHLLAALVHGSAHALLPVGLPAWADALVLATVFVGPIAGVWLDRRGHRVGLPLFTLSMAGALLLGLTLHFVVPGADNVATLPVDPWRLPFRVSAVAVAVTPALGAAVGAWYWSGRSG